MDLNLGALAFWIFVAAVVVAGIWKRRHSEALRHETVRLMIEKNMPIDEAQLAELLNPRTPEWISSQTKPGKPGDAYRVLRIIGVIMIFIALGLLIAGAVRGMILGFNDSSMVGLATGISLVAMIGIGLFVASRYVPAPPSNDHKHQQGL